MPSRNNIKPLPISRAKRTTKRRPRATALFLTISISWRTISRGLIRHIQHNNRHSRHRRTNQRNLNHIATPALFTRIQRKHNSNSTVNRPISRTQWHRRINRRQIRSPALKIRILTYSRADNTFKCAKWCSFIRRSKPRQRKINQPRIPRSHLFCPQTQSLHNARAKIFNNHIRRTDQLHRHCAIICIFQIERNALFAPIKNAICRGIVIRRTRPIHLNHLSPLIREQHPRQRPGNIMTKIDNADPSQWRLFIAFWIHRLSPFEILL